MDDQKKAEEIAIDEDHQMPAWREVFLYFLMLGFINVGGPVAQITMMYNHMVERRHWLSNDRFVQVMGFCHMLPGPEALQLAIYVGYLKRKFLGGILAGLTFIIPGAFVMIVLSWLYVKYGSLPQVNDVLYVLKPAVLGIIAAGIIKIGRAAIKSLFLAALVVSAFVGMHFAGINFLLILLLAGILNLLVKEGWPRLRHPPTTTPALIVGLGAFTFTESHWFQMAWLFLKTGLFSFGGAYASLIFLQRGAVDQYHWLTAGQLLDGVALSVATPGPFMLFTTFVAHIPVILLTLVLIFLEVSEAKHWLPRALEICFAIVFNLLSVVITFLANSVIAGMTVLIVMQLTLAPLRPVQIRPAFAVLKKRWRAFLSTSIRVGLRILLGFILLIIPGFLMMVRYTIYAPIVLLEGLEKKAALKRARELVSRSKRTVVKVVFLQLMIPLIVTGIAAKIANISDQDKNKLALKIYAHLLGLLNILVVPLISIMVALIYMKLRQIGGEILKDTLEQLEMDEMPRSKWQQRMRKRLSLHTRSSKH